jgi:hypothetical protein
MPKIVDYAGRFAFFELASFTLVRDHGVDHLSRHALARVLATSISTIRRLLNSEADLRQLALNEVAYRRRRRLTPPTRATGVDAGARLLLPWIPTRAYQVAEELVWWRLSIVVRTTAPSLEPDDVPHHAEVLHALVDGLGVAVCLGRMRPDEAAVLVRDHLGSLARVAGCPAPSP